MPDSAAQVFLGPRDVEGHHHLPGLVGRLGNVAVVEVRRERDEALCGEAVGHVLYVRDEPPPLLYDDDAGAAAPFGQRQIPSRRPAVALKLDHLAGHLFPVPPEGEDCRATSGNLPAPPRE